MGNDGRDSEGVVRRHLIGNGRGEEELLEIDAKPPFSAQKVGGRCAGAAMKRRDLPAWIIGIHSAIGINRDAEADGVGQSMNIAESGEEESIIAAVCIAVEAERIAGTACVARGRKQ